MFLNGREAVRLDMGGTSKAMTLTCCCLGMKLQGLPAWKLKNGVGTSKDGIYPWECCWPDSE